MWVHNPICVCHSYTSSLFFQWFRRWVSTDFSHCKYAFYMIHWNKTLPGVWAIISCWVEGAVLFLWPADRRSGRGVGMFSGSPATCDLCLLRLFVPTTVELGFPKGRVKRIITWQTFCWSHLLPCHPTAQACLLTQWSTCLFTTEPLIPIK